MCRRKWSSSSVDASTEIQKFSFNEGDIIWVLSWLVMCRADAVDFLLEWFVSIPSVWLFVTDRWKGYNSWCVWEGPKTFLFGTNHCLKWGVLQQILWPRDLDCWSFWSWKVLWKLGFLQIHHLWFHLCRVVLSLRAFGCHFLIWAVVHLFGDAKVCYVWHLWSSFECDLEFVHNALHLCWLVNQIQNLCCIFFQFCFFQRKPQTAIV